MINFTKKIMRKTVNFFGYEIGESNSAFNSEEIKRSNFNENIANNSRKIHYGCGSNLLGGWLNVDLHPRVEKNYISLIVDLTAPHPFPDNCFEFGFSEDFIEHLSQADSIIFLSEVYRTFKPGGILRLSFPGLEGVLKKHYKNSDCEKVLTGKKEAYIMWEHLHFYSKEELLLVCKHIGFKGKNFVEYGKSIYDDLKNLDTREDQIDLNTYVEITK